MTQKKEVIKHSAAVQISNKMTLTQRKSWNVLLTNAFDDLRKQDIFEISVETLKALIEYKRHDKESLNECLEALSTIYVKWNILEKDKQNEWGVMSLLAEAIVDKNEILKYSYGPMLRKRLQEPKMYVKINILVQNKFTSVQSLALFELVLDYLNIKQGYGETPWMDISKTKEFYGIEENEYPQFKYLNSCVIQKAIKEVIKISGLLVEPEFKRRSRKVAGVKYHVKINPGEKNIFDMVPDKNMFNIKEQLDKIGKTIPPTSTTKPRQKAAPETAKDSSLASLLQLIPEDQRRFITASRLITASYKRHGYEYTKSNGIYAAKRSKGGYCGYLRKAIDNNYAKARTGHQPQPKANPAPKQSAPSPKPEIKPKKWPIVEYQGQIFDLSFYQDKKPGNTIIAIDKTGGNLSPTKLYDLYQQGKIKAAEKKCAPIHSAPAQKLPKVKYNNYTVDLEEHLNVHGNCDIVVAKDEKGRDVHYGNLLIQYQLGKAEVIDEHEGHINETNEVELEVVE